ncbi:intradiol ring-cleavage dioxygenase [Nonomuraea jiangxiensis]|uniref:Dioxygenase n=1 Tax=Nonomuraea jiangxiensis TaxID=633440 RepID=A0A1G9DBQ3_9ACTN|nr:intradiol ring-cleavage dioxygenase [Nonomuraea jiangxiensis]SDK61312.1 Dioxygenase [Nonomuraea jiangxiensis]
MTHDHEGQRVSRRRLITNIGLGSLGLGSVGFGGLLGVRGAGATTVTTSRDLLAEARACAVTPAVTKGPFYFDANQIRSDIRDGKPGVRLRLAIKVQNSTCQPLPGALVDLWQCDASGLYSGGERGSMIEHVESREITHDRTWPDLKPTDGKRYLRGAQLTDAEGVVEFTTIWPGWYPGRTVHIHAMVHMGGTRALTTQLMFEEELNWQVLSRPPYVQHRGRDTLNASDLYFQNGLLLTVVEDGDGYWGAIILSVGS